MPDDVTVKIHDDYIAWLFSADDSPISDALDEVADEVLAAARLLAPVSTAGSKFAPSGFLKSRITKADATHTDDGLLARFVGTRTNRRGGAYPYPYAFLANDAGSTWNRGHHSKRSATDYFLQAALDEVPFLVFDY